MSAQLMSSYNSSSTNESHRAIGLKGNDDPKNLYLARKAYESDNAISYWYALRVTYGREIEARDLFIAKGIKSFVPMQYDFVTKSDGSRVYELIPATHNLLFVHSSFNEIDELKKSAPLNDVLRYIKKHGVEGNLIPKSKVYMTVRDTDMENFLRVAHKMEDVIYLDYEKAKNIEGQPVRIIEGHMAGAKGVLKRIGKNKQVVVELPGFNLICCPRYISKQMIKVEEK